MHELDGAATRYFWDYMLHCYGAKNVPKSESWLMRTLAVVLSLLNIVSKTSFLQRYASTIGRKIYTPFEVGVPIKGWSLLSQVVVCIHECQHIVQQERLGRWHYTYQYLFSSTKRAELEAEAYSSKLAFYKWAFGTLPLYNYLSDALAHYNLSSIEIERAISHLPVDGSFVNEATKRAIEWFVDTKVRIAGEDAT